MPSKLFPESSLWEETKTSKCEISVAAIQLSSPLVGDNREVTLSGKVGVRSHPNLSQISSRNPKCLFTTYQCPFKSYLPAMELTQRCCNNVSSFIFFYIFYIFIFLHFLHVLHLHVFTFRHFITFRCNIPVPFFVRCDM